MFHDSDVSDSSIEELKRYEEDLNLAELKNEVLQFKTFISKENIISPVSMWSLIQENNIIVTFPNLNIILRIYLTLPISNASGERSFSVMARIKIFLRSTLGQQKLNSLSLLYKEKEILNNSINYDELIDEFAELKVRKKAI